MQPEKAEPPDAPIIDTPTHVYFILPVEQWGLAAQFVAENVSPNAAFPNDPEESSVLVAVNRESLEIEGVICVMKRVIVDHYACKSGKGVSYSTFHELIRAALPAGSVYYTAVADNIGGQHAAEKAGLQPYAKLALTVVGVEGESYAVGSTDHRGR